MKSALFRFRTTQAGDGTWFLAELLALPGQAWELIGQYEESPAWQSIALPELAPFIQRRIGVFTTGGGWEIEVEASDEPVEAIAVSSGAADADKLVKTDGGGRIDPSLLPAQMPSTLFKSGWYDPQGRVGQIQIQQVGPGPQAAGICFYNSAGSLSSGFWGGASGGLFADVRGGRFYISSFDSAIAEIWSGGLSLNRGVLKLPGYSKASLPSADAGTLILVRDDAGGPTIAWSDGNYWRRISDNTVIS